MGNAHQLRRRDLWQRANAAGRGLAHPSGWRREAAELLSRPAAPPDFAAGRYRERQPRAAGGLRPLSAGGTHHHRQPATQASELPRRSRRACRARLGISQSLAGNRGDAAKGQKRLQLFDQRARRSRRSTAGGGAALLHARQTRRSAVHRREPHRSHSDGIDVIACHRGRLRCERACRGRQAHAAEHLRLAVRYAVPAQPRSAPAGHRQAAARGPVGRFAHHRRESEEHAAQRRNGRVGRDRARQRQGQSHGHLRNKILGGAMRGATNRGRHSTRLLPASRFALAWVLAAAPAWILAATPAMAADTFASMPSDLSVTVYRAPYRSSASITLNALEGFALISETRTLQLPEGLSRLRFEGVADGIEASSAIVTGLPAGVIEKNREGKLLSPSALVAAAVGKPVTLLRTDKKTGKSARLAGTIRSDAGGGVVFETSEGIEALACWGLPRSLIFLGVTDLAATPTLSVLVRSPGPVTRMVTLSYLARAFDWAAG